MCSRKPLLEVRWASLAKRVLGGVVSEGLDQSICSDLRSDRAAFQYDFNIGPSCSPSARTISSCRTNFR
jgi:hypothetical protein